MPRKSKWENVEFAYADFRSAYSPRLILDVVDKVKDSAYQSMLDGNPEALIAAVKGIDFPVQALTDGGFSGTLSWTYQIRDGLVHLAEMLWYRNAPTPQCFEVYGQRRGLPAEEIKDELCKHRAGMLMCHFTHAWRLLDSYISERIQDLLHALADEVLVQTFCELGPNDLPLTREQLYKLAVGPQERQRKARMKIRHGGSESRQDLLQPSGHPFNLRWFPQHYARAYRQLAHAAEIYKRARTSTDKQERKAWPQVIKERYSELDDELIARLSGRASDLTDEHNALLSTKGGESTVSDIALEQAARWCGIKPYSYTKRGLLKRIEGKLKSDNRVPAPGIYTFLLNWHRFGRVIDQDQIKQIMALASSIVKLPSKKHLEGE